MIALVGLVATGQPLPAEEDFVWGRADAVEAGFDAVKLESLRDAWVDRGTQALLIIRADQMVMEWYAADREPEDRHYTASLAKALCGGFSLALAVDAGVVGLDDPVVDYIDRWADDPQRAAMRVRQLAQHTSGLEDAADPEAEVTQNELPGWKGAFWRGRSGGPPDPITVTLEKTPVIFEPGTAYAYSNPGFAALAYVVATTMEPDARTALRRRVMEPIGLAGGEWSVGYGRTFDVDGYEVVPNWGGGSFTPRAVARLGRLVLHEGRWSAEQVLSSEAMRAMIDTHPPQDVWDSLPPAQPVPGLGWYVNANNAWPDAPRDAIVGAGAQHQTLIVIPSLDLIVVRNGGNLDGDLPFWEAMHAHLVEPLMDALADNASE